MSSRDIRAGKAFVEVYADKTRLNKTLKTISADLQAFGAGVSSLGKKFMVLGAGIAAPLLAATKRFMSFGDQLDKMAARTGMSTNALSEYGYVAQMSGASIEDVEKSVRKMQKTIADAASGEKTYVDALAAAGTSFQELQGLSPEKQFEKIAAGINAISDPTMKAAAAVEIFGRSGTMLLPMLKDLKEGQAEAKRLGLSIDPEQAKQAAELEDAWTRVKFQFTAIAVTVGSALAPMLTGLADSMKDGIKTIREWVNENKSWITTTFMAGATAIAAGAGLLVLGKAITFIGWSFGALLTAAKAAVATFGFLQSAVLLLANPFVLVGAAVVALGGYLLYTTGTAGKAASWISETFATLLSEVTETFGVIAESMAAGDLVSAAKVGWALIKLEWQKGVAFISGLWESFKGLYDEAVTGLAIGMINASAKIQTIWADLLNWMAKKWEEFSNSGFTETLTQALAPLVAWMGGGTVDEAQQTIATMFEHQRANQGNKFAAMDAETQAKKEAIEKERAGSVDVLGGDLARRNAQRDAASKSAQDAVDAARAEWEAAKGEARAKAAGARAQGSRFNFAGAADEVDMLAATGGKSSVAGTFSASAVAGMGTGGIQERIAKNTEQTAKAQEAIKQILDKTGRIMGKLESWFTVSE